MAKKKAAVKAGKKKKWFKILAPAVFNKAEVGELPLFEPEQALGRTVTVNLMTLTRDPKKQDKLVSFVIDGKTESMFTTFFKSYKMMPSAVKRLVRRNKSKVTDSFMVFTKDKRELQLKPVLVTRTKVNRSVKSDLRKECKLLAKEFLLKLDYEHFLSLLITDKFQKQLQEELKKITPLSACRIRMMILVK